MIWDTFEAFYFFGFLSLLYPKTCLEILKMKIIKNWSFGVLISRPSNGVLKIGLKHQKATITCLNRVKFQTCWSPLVNFMSSSKLTKSAFKVVVQYFYSLKTPLFLGYYTRIFRKLLKIFQQLFMLQNHSK